jgi:hypothetical protein
MDEAAYRQTLATVFSRYCPFEKSILTACAACEQANKRNIAEREAVTCADAGAHAQCIALHELLREKFMFALGVPHIDAPLPHRQEMHIQCGGLQGLQFEVSGDAEVRNVAALVVQAQRQYGELANFPFAQMVRYATAQRAKNTR